MADKRIISGKFETIQIVNRQTLPPAPGSAAVRHEYVPILTTRAAVRVASGETQFASVEINGQRVTHTFTIRQTKIAFDTRDRVRTVDGTLYQILNVIDPDMGGVELRIQTSRIGDEVREAAR